jgi:hypothetical protein
MPQPPSNKKPAVFSVVIRSVDHDITENDVKEELDSLELKIDRIWRIKSMKTNQFTPLIRVTTSETATIDTLITQGITLFGRHHKCEPSHTSPQYPLNAPDASIEGT